jgi:flagella basal body P-ring formation protein FlgA
LRELGETVATTVRNTTSARDRAAVTADRLPAPVRDRRPALAAVAVLLILAGALASGLLVYRSGERTDVLVARDDIDLGQTITDRDFATARVAADGAAVVSAAARRNFVGSVATTRIPRGTLVNRTMFLRGTVVPSGAEVVGLNLAASQRPAEDLHPGDVVRVYLVPRADAGGANVKGTALVRAVRVVTVGTARAGSSQGLPVSVLVPAGSAPDVVANAASGQVAVVRLASDTKPAVDFRTG